ncbi:hypothetical protein A1Q1_07434 [Trichosporon asahii var. asahii CBS 2479]|uniref:OTU domain-containing protein n=1 Tax=Trichosporon asahii var. asahii (strain ATCC 90039 / CBS 2479 / JCM 2466 / KCTC 7840 / NBRC 103889/ NCYC 2677 / UAMH 7654) TaxID=1186058 RepID=J6F7L6_TRIAS|nr:hypothetical protein A1Q1_07434 [Trichosporon asahii var. asahii CBS 2479]EJT51342.1 hypothetical protein A1Q1_07434 [Trichosporon asahii var. asahii CBS 2479]
MGYKRTAKVAATARDMRSTRTSTTVANRVTVAPVAKVKAAHGKSLAMNRKRLTPTVNKRHPIVWIDNTGFDFGAYPAWPKMSKPTKQTAASVESSDAVFDGDSTPGSADDNAIAPHGNLNHAVETHDSDAEDANITDDDAAAFDGGGDSDSADLEGHSDNSVAADAAAADVSKRISLDVFNSLGWNAGLRTPTRSLDPVAWWRTVEISDEAMSEVELLAILNRLYPTDLDKRNLVAIIRTKGKKKGFPCRKNEKHSYDIKARHPPRWQCRDKSCKDNLPLGQAMRWVAQLIINDWVPRQAVGIPSARRQSDTADDSRRVTNDKLGVVHRTPLSSVTPPRRIDKAFRPPPAINRLRFEVPGMSRLVRLPVEPAYYRTRWTIGDGNCQFRAFAKAYDGIDHIAARKAAVDYMFENFKQFEAFYADDEMEKQYGDFDMYLDAMAKQFEYGDQLTLAALAASYKVSIKVLHMSHTLDYEWVDGGDSDSGRVIKLFFNAGTKHYENLVAARDL